MDLPRDPTFRGRGNGLFVPPPHPTPSALQCDGGGGGGGDHTHPKSRVPKKGQSFDLFSYVKILYKKLNYKVDLI